MALFLPNETFAYIDATEKIKHVDGTDVIDRGPWSGSIAYVPNDVVSFNNMLFVALAANFNMSPTSIVDENWSSLVRTTGEAQDITVSELYALIIQTGSVAYDALRTAWAGTAAASWAYPALVTAWTGTAAAYEALQQAWYGTEAAATIGYPALVTSWVGTATANSALAAAAHGTDTANTAYNIAISGTSLAYTALQQAWYGTEAAATIGYPALVTAWVGTNTANSALIAATAGTITATHALEVASTGTNAAAAAINLANQVAILAQAGTVPPFLDELQDVDAPSPTVSQVLAWDGSKWVAGDAPSTVATAAFTYYLQDTSSGTGGYETLLPLPTGGTQEADQAVVSSATGAVLIEGYLGAALNRTLIDAGVWEFSTYATTDSQPGTVAVDIYVRDNFGAETLLLSGTSQPVASQSTPQLLTTIVTTDAVAVQPTDKIVAKYWAFTQQTTPVTIAIYHNGTAAYSHFHTPLRTSHNDLAGLQGGAAFEYYHTTKDENDALAGTDGLPSASNKFVTDTDSRLATGVHGYYLATSGTAQAEDAYDLAQLAYDLASANPAQPDVGNWLLSGGNVVWVSGYNFDVAPSTVAFNGTAVSFAGTSISLDTADPTNDRIDLVVADSGYGTIAVVTGVPSTPPAPPTYDPDTQFQLTFIPVDANTTQPAEVDIAWIYLENTEWTLTAAHASINVNSTANPYAGTKSIEGTSCPNGALVRYQAPYVFELNNYQTLYFYLAPKASWGTRSIRVSFETSSAVTGRTITINNGAYGFSTSNLGYQLIAIPISAFNVAAGTQILRLRFAVVSSGAAMSGFYIDNVGLQLGVAPPTQGVPDATTTVKGIVQLEQNGGTIPGRAVTGDDYRLALATVGTQMAYDALQQAWYGTQAAGDIGYPALVTAWVGTATANTALTVATTSTNTDVSLQNQINAINSALGISFQGTFSLYMANFRNGPPDNLVSVVNGVVTGLTPSYYVWEDFELYPTGTLPPLDKGSAWAGEGTISNTVGLGIVAEDYVYYGTGTYIPSVTVLNGGTGWAQDGTIVGNYLGITGTDLLDTYSLGTLYGTNVTYGTYYGSGYIDGGFGWAGTALIYSY